MSKLCIDCNIVKPRIEFHKAIRNLDGLSNTCKGCKSIKAAKRHQAKNTKRLIVDGVIPEKMCKICTMVKPITDFHIESHGVLGVRGSCSDCDSKRHKTRYEKLLKRERPLDFRVGEKQCKTCNITKSKFEFQVQSRNKDFLAFSCKSCVSEKLNSEEYKEAHKEARLRYMTRKGITQAIAAKLPSVISSKREKHKVYSKTLKGRLKSYKSSAKKRNIPFELTEEEFQKFWQGVCEYCGTTIETLGIDRVDTSLGYTLDNTVACCTLCNRMKLDHNVTDFLDQCKKIVENLLKKENKSLQHV